jgi:hypothetical protein
MNAKELGKFKWKQRIKEVIADNIVTSLVLV